MKFRFATALMGLAVALASVMSSQAAFDLSIGNITVNGTGGSFSVFATATGQAESVTAYTLKLNLTGASAGDLPVTFAEGPGATPGFIVVDTNANNSIAALNGTGAGVGGNTIGFSTFAAATPFALATPVQVGTFTFTTANGFNPGDFIDVGFVFGSTADTTFSNAASQPITLAAVGGTSQTGNLPGVASSTRIAAVPEPSTFGLLGLVGAAFGLRRKRRTVSC